MRTLFTDRASKSLAAEATLFLQNRTSAVSNGKKETFLNGRRVTFIFEERRNGKPISTKRLKKPTSTKN